MEKLGQCQCHNAECPEARDPAYARVVRGADGRCPNDAVRMVTVRPAHPMHVPGPVYTWESDPPHVPIPAEIQVPMCEPCAAYHEQTWRRA